MAIFDFKTTLDYADSMVRNERMFDIREKMKGIKVGDIVKYHPWYKGRAVKGHPILEKKYRVIYVDDSDPRVMKDFDIFQVAEIKKEFD